MTVSLQGRTRSGPGTTAAPARLAVGETAMLLLHHPIHPY